jgi:hypothetical protein
MKQNLLYLILGIFLLASCQQEELTESKDAYGYLSLRSIIAQIENVNNPASRAALPTIDTEALFVKICEGDKEVITYEPGEVPEQIPLPIGTYTAKAYNAAYQTYESWAEDAQGEPVFYGEETFTITADTHTEVTLEVSLYNFGITFQLGDNFGTYFKTEQTELTLMCNGRNVTLDAGQQSSTYVYFYLEENSKLNYTLVSRNDDDETVTLSGTPEVANGKCYTLIFTFNPESRSLSVAD